MPDALPETKPEQGASAGAHMRDECAPIKPGRPRRTRSPGTSALRHERFGTAVPAHGVTRW